LESAGDSPLRSELSLNAGLNIIDAEESRSDGIESLFLRGGLGGELSSELTEKVS